jgi:hypothetical protein
VKTVEISDATESLSHYARSSQKEPLLVTLKGKPYAALMPVGSKTDLENLIVSTHPTFLAIMERSERRWREEGGVRSDRVREKLGIKRRATKRPKR